MSEELRQRFIDALYAAGWRAPCDAQWSNIDKVIAEFCVTSPLAEHNTKIAKLEHVLEHVGDVLGLKENDNDR